MNQSTAHSPLTNPSLERDDEKFDLTTYLDLLLDNRWLIAAVAFVVTVAGAIYSVAVTPIYQANLLVQVEENANSPASMFGNLAGAFDLKSAATAEIEILRSRSVIGRAVTNSRFHTQVAPHRFPLIGGWLARGRKGISAPGIFGIGGYAWGAESIDITDLAVPAGLYGKPFVLTVLSANSYRLSQAEFGIDFVGQVGTPAQIATTEGAIAVQVNGLRAQPGVKFNVVQIAHLDAVENLQKSISISEKGKQSGVIGLALEGSDPESTALILNEVAREYLRQNIDRKSEEAKKSLDFLEKQLPVMKQNLEQAEERYNTLRNQRGTVDLGEEAKAILQQSVAFQTRLVELKQKRDELLTLFQPVNPIVKAVEQQIGTLHNQLSVIGTKIRQMPEIEQEVLRLTRDIKVNTELYTSLLNSAQQLRLVKASKVGNARLVDGAVVPRYPVRPKRSLVVVVSVLLGTVAGVAIALVRKSLFGGIQEPHEVEDLLGLTVSAAIPHSTKQSELFEKLGARVGQVAVLAQEDPTDLAIESLRSFRTSLQFTMLGAKNKIIMITGPTPGVGKSFVSANFTVVLASAGKRVLLIDGDLRKGYLQRYFGVERANGLSEVISGAATLGQVTHANVLPNIDFISTGNLPPRPAELLEHPRFKEVLDQVVLNYDYVVIDTAPILAVTDAMIVAPHVGAIFNVVRGDVSTLGEIDEAVNRLKKSGHEVSGVVFNGLRNRVGRYGYGSRYGKYRYTQYKY